MRKLLRFLALFVIVATFLSGCKNSEVTDSDNENMTPVGTYPIVKEKVTLKYWVPLHAQASQFISSYNENEVYQEMEKITNIHMDFIHPAIGQEKEQFNLMIASQDYADIIGSAGRYGGWDPPSIYNSGPAMAVEDGVYADLKDYLPKYAPDYYKLVTDDEEIKRNVTFGEAMPIFVLIKPDIDPPFRRFITRSDWLEEFGMEAPVTIGQWEAYFKALKEKKNIKTPLSLLPSGMEELWLGAFNLLPRFFISQETGKVVYCATQPAFKDYLKLMNKWYNLGYISQDFPSIKAAQHINMFTSENTGVLATAVGAAYSLCKPLNIPVVSTRYPRFAMGDKLHNGPFVDKSGDGSAVTAISAKSKYIKEAVRWLNYSYTEEGSTLFNYGVEGKSMERDANGRPHLTDYILKSDKYPPEATNYILKAHLSPKLAPSDMVCNPTLLSNPEGIAFRKLYSDDPDIDNASQLGSYRMTGEEASERATIMTNVDNYTNEMILKFIMNVEPLDRFDAFVAELNSLGIERAVEITQNAKDRISK